MLTVHPSDRRSVLLVCFGNLCRSPMAEGLMRQQLPEAGWTVHSAGTHAIGGDPPTMQAHRAVAHIAGVDIAEQRSTPLTVDLLRASDFILTMSRQQALEVAALAPEAAPRTRLLGSFAPSPSDFDGPADPFGPPADAMEIADPMGGSSEIYEACCLRLIDATDLAARWLLDGAVESAAPPAVAAWNQR